MKRMRIVRGTLSKVLAKELPDSFDACVTDPPSTVKPVTLMRWLCRLVTPPGGIVLDPFAGSGTTGVAAIQEGFGFYMIEREQEYIELALARVKHAMKNRKSVPDAA